MRTFDRQSIKGLSHALRQEIADDDSRARDGQGRD